MLSLKYEDFLADRKAAVKSVLAHALGRGFKLYTDEDKAVDQLEAMINPQRSPTFRQGKSGGWKTQFSPENKALFKEIAGDLLIRIGYEDNKDW